MKNSTHSQYQRRGIALIAVLWVIAFLSTLLVVTLTLLKVDVDDNVAEVQSYRAWQMAHTGLSYGLHPGVQRDDPLLLSVDDGFDEGYAVTISPEASRLSINKVLKSNDKALLFDLFKKWGLDDKQADDLIGALVDWTDGDEVMVLNGAEKEYYTELGYIDRPYNRDFRNLDEMVLVRGFGQLEDLQPNWREFFSVWAEGALDIREAAPDLLAIAAEVDDTAAEDFHQRVKGDDGIIGTEDDIQFSNINEALDELASPVGRREVVAARFTLKGEVLRIESEGRSGNFRYLIQAISGSKSAQTDLLDYKEKQLGSE